MAKIVVKSEFHARYGKVLRVDENGLTDFDEYDWQVIIASNEIPEFIAWLQAEYDKQKAGD